MTHGEGLRHPRRHPRLATIEAPSLFPFASPDTVYAGACGANNPNPNGEANPPGAAAMASVLVPPNGSPPKVTLQLPALELTVKSGASVVSGARVTISDDKLHRSAATRSSASTRRPRPAASPSPGSTSVEDPGLPWSTYDVCASAQRSRNIEPAPEGGQRRGPEPHHRHLPDHRSLRQPARKPAAASAHDRELRAIDGRAGHDAGRADGRPRRRDRRPRRAQHGHRRHPA